MASWTYLLSSVYTDKPDGPVVVDVVDLLSASVTCSPSCSSSFSLSRPPSFVFLFFSFLEKKNCVLSWLPFHLFVHLRWPNTSQKSCLMVKILQTLQSTVHVCLIIINCLRLLFKTSACSCSLNRQEIRSIRQLGYHFLASKNQRYVIDNPKKEQKVIEIWLINVIM